MAETISGGCYKDAEGDGYHDAHGQPVSAENVARFFALHQAQFGLGALDPAPAPAEQEEQPTEEQPSKPKGKTSK